MRIDPASDQMSSTSAAGTPPPDRSVPLVSYAELAAAIAAVIAVAVGVMLWAAFGRGDQTPEPIDGVDSVAARRGPVGTSPQDTDPRLVDGSQEDNAPERATPAAPDVGDAAPTAPPPVPTAPASDAPAPGPDEATATAVAEVPEPVPGTGVRDVDPYRGLGAWLDVWDFVPAYADDGVPRFDVSVIDDMASNGVRTIYLQASRVDDISTTTLVDEPLLGTFLQRAHERNIAVVGWYLPRWDDADDDLARLSAIADFEWDGHRFDGVAVDIEGVPEPEQRDDWNRRLISLSADLKAHVGDDVLGAIVLPPPLLEVVNPQYWPDFPWAEIAPFYDVWLPMSYWSNRDADSPFANGYTYNHEATVRLRRNIGDPAALVHGIGGIGAVADPDGVDGESRARSDQLADFARSLTDTGSIGGSIYDWATMDAAARAALGDLLD